MSNIKIYIASLFISLPCFAVPPKWTETEWKNFFTALQKCETGQYKDNGINATGDNGKAIGPYQIWKSYYDDAVKYDNSLKSGSLNMMIEYTKERRRKTM